MNTETSLTVRKSQRFQKANGQKKWYYRPLDGDRNDIVPVWMTFEERFDREQNGFIELPDGREARIDISFQIKKENSQIGQQSGERMKTRPQWPHTTDLVGVHPSQVSELREHLKLHDVRGVDVNSDGSVTWNSKRARHDYCRATHLYDRNAGYSDPAPLNK